MRKLVSIHGFQGSPEEGWSAWLAGEFATQGWQTAAPQMPSPNNPLVNEWVSSIDATMQSICGPTEETVLVGHSLGCIAVLRYLEQLPSEAQIGQVVLVGGFNSDLGWDELENFFEEDINWNAINSHGAQFTAIHSTNDKYVSLHYADNFKARLNAEVHILENAGHMAASDGYYEFPFLKKTIEDFVI